MGMSEQSAEASAQRDVVGCVYINPATKEGHDAEVFLWAHGCTAIGGGDCPKDAALEAVVRKWLADSWPCFSVVRWPGRECGGWDAWDALPVRVDPVPCLAEDAGSVFMAIQKFCGRPVPLSESE